LKYTNYLINKDFMNIKKIDTNNRNMKAISIGMSVFVMVCGVGIACTLLPMSISTDGYRYFRFQYLKSKKIKNNSNN